MSRTPLLLLSAALLAGFRTAGPQAATAGAPPALTGSWTYTAPELHMRDGNKDTKCSMTGVTLSLQQRDTMLIGSTRGGTLRCEGRPDRPVSDAPISEGSVHDRTVTFHLGPFLHSGTISSRGVRGHITIPQRPVTGEFRLVRQ